MNSVSDGRGKAVAGLTSPDTRSPTVFVLAQLPSTGKGVSYTCASIARGIAEKNLHVELFTPYGFERSSGNYRVNNTLPVALRVVPYMRLSNFAKRRNEAIFLKRARHAASRASAVADMWPNPDISLLRKLREVGIPTVREMINCHVATAKRLLDAEYRRLGLQPGHTITPEHVDYETKALELYDYVFCSNPLAEKSVVEHGVPLSKIRSTSFGWDPARFRGEGRALPPIDGATFLFVGLICVRKGAHLIMRYWAKSGIRGRLVLVGKLEPAIAKTCEEYIRRDDVMIVDHTSKIGEYYRSADVFVFPTLEEGGPQVTYEAGGCGLPLIVSPMGAARLADHTTGFALDPFDEEGWIEAMRKLAKDAELRREMGSAAQRGAERFTWREVSNTRAEAFKEIVRTFRAAAGQTRSDVPPRVAPMSVSPSASNSRANA